MWGWYLDEYKDGKARAQVHGVQSQMHTFECHFELRLSILPLRHSDTQ